MQDDLISNAALEAIIENTVKEFPEQRQIIFKMSQKVEEYFQLGAPYGETTDGFFDWFFDTYIE